MKNFKNLGQVIFALIACICMTIGCSNENIINEEQDIYTVKIGWGGELDVTYEPLSRASGDDVYGIQVYSAPKEGENATWTPYAYGLFNTDDISISLLKGYKYKFVATMVKDGKNKLDVYESDGVLLFLAPFSTNGGTSLENKFKSKSNVSLSGISRGNSMMKSGLPYDIPNTDRYYGELEDYIPGDKNDNANISMKRASFGAKFIAKGKAADSGTLEIQITDAPKMELTPTTDKKYISDTFTFKDVKAAWNNDGIYSETVSVTINWNRTDGTTVPLGTHDVIFKRNTTTVVNVNVVNDNSSENVGYEIDEEELGEMPEDENINIEDGEIVEAETNVTPYLTFSADGEQTLTMTKAVGTLEYSVNGGTWTTMGTTTVTFGGDNGDLRLRGQNIMGTSHDITSDYSTISFGNNDINVKCKGDIRTLVDYENYANVNTASARFRNLFRDCIALTTAPELPAKELAKQCYMEMFSGCTSLTMAPELPATELPDQCYMGMFSGCTSLTTAPELPATSLSIGSYYGMFYGCTSLTTAPELPAMTLTGHCYFRMFYGCTSLSTAPTLPSIELEKSCYYEMFAGCTNLTTAPELPAKVLPTYCYASMFSGCTNLTTAPTLPGKILTQGCYENMFLGCSKLNSITMLAEEEEDSWHSDWLSGVAPEGTITITKEFYYTKLNSFDTFIPEGWTVIKQE